MKTITSARGARIDCPNFNPCRFCFGCRNYDASVIKCEECFLDDAKENICKTDLHTTKALNMMLKIKTTSHLGKDA